MVDSWGRLDVLVNNAGFAILSPAEEMSVVDFKRVFDLDVFGMFICSKVVSSRWPNKEGPLSIWRACAD